MSERKIGTCQWCGRHWALLYFVTGVQDVKLWCGWICEQCLVNARDEFMNDAMKRRSTTDNEDDLFYPDEREG